VSEHATAGDHITWFFTRLNRYADELPDDYRDRADPLISLALAESFLAHIEEYSAGRRVTIKPPSTDGDCPTVELQTEDGAEVRIKFYGEEAFELWYTIPGGECTANGNFQLGTTWTHLDRSGLVFLTHMFVDEGRIEVPEASEVGG
jgi:hypothetical protein